MKEIRKESKHVTHTHKTKSVKHKGRQQQEKRDKKFIRQKKTEQNGNQ